MSSNASWWISFFEDDSIADLILERRNSDLHVKEIDFLMDALELQVGDLVYDQCCGIGEISCGLAKRGIATIAVDCSAPYIRRAKEKAITNGLECAFYQADACEFICPKQAKGSLNWYTSFGYSSDDQINLKMLQNAYNNTQKGGRFVLDYTNPLFVFNHFVASKTIKKMTPEGEMTCIKDSVVDAVRGMFLSTWTYTLPNGEMKKRSGESRIYFARDLIDMLQVCGFTIKDIKGDVSGEAFSGDSPRCIVIAQK
jgi:SAM-dependent methyltransferase